MPFLKKEGLIKKMFPRSKFSKPMIKEDYAIVLDYLSNGYPMEAREKPYWPSDWEEPLVFIGGCA